MPSNFKALAGASGGEPNDPNFKNVTLLLHGDGSNGAQNNTFLDNSTNNFTITRNGNTTQGSFSPYGSNWSNYFDGSGDYISAPSNAALDCGTGDWTFECWVFVSTRTTNYPLIFGNNRGGFTTDALAITASNSDSGGIYQDKFVVSWGSSGWSSPSTGNAALLVANATNSNNTWYHLALVRNGTSVKMYRNGVEVASATVSSGATFNWGYTNSLLGGGNWDGANGNFNGYISNARLLKGTALYTAAFTPSTTPLTAITNTSLLTCQSNRFRDASTNNFTITRNGDVKVTNFAPFAPSAAYSTTTNGGSAYMDGTGDYLTVASNLALAPRTGDFTWECWIYPISFNDGVFWITDVYSGFQVGFQNSTTWGVAQAVIQWYMTSTTLPTLNSWNHIAVTRSGTNMALFLNGNRIATKTSATADFVAGTTGIMAIASGSYAVQGYASDMRLVKGTAVYDPTVSTYTVPTSPLSAVTNTNFLLKPTNAAIFDNSMKNDLETVGNAQISTSVKKFGTGSMAFDGTGDYLKGPNSDAFAFGAGDYTIELWMNTNADNGNVIDFRVGGNLTPYPAIYLSGGGAYFWTGTGSDGVSVGSYTKNAWVHLAVSRSGSSLKFFINGTQTYSASNSTNLSQGTVVVGARWDAGSAFAGYIDDLRVTKGVARYTSAFTAPTAPFPNK